MQMKSCQSSNKNRKLKNKSKILSFFSNDKIFFIKDDDYQELYQLFFQKIQRSKTQSNLKVIVITLLSIRSIPILNSLPFKKMVHLALNNNQIHSLERMQHYDMPNLKTLSLHANKITSIRSLKKCHFPQLQKLKIHDNKINNFAEFELVDFSNLRVLFCFDNPSAEQRDNIYMNTVFLDVAKSNFQRLQVLRNQVQLNRTILHNPLEVMLEEKYDGLFINQQLISAPVISENQLQF